MPHYTQQQSQYLAFIAYYTKVNRRPPAEADIQHFFNVTPPTVQQIILTLEKSGFISRKQGKARTIKVLLLPDQLPYLEYRNPMQHYPKNIKRLLHDYMIEAYEKLMSVNCTVSWRSWIGVLQNGVMGR